MRRLLCCGFFVLAMCGAQAVFGQCLITCPANVTVSNDANQCGAVVNYPAPTVSGCTTVTCSPASGSFFPRATTTINCTDAPSGVNCSFTVTVNDTQPPTVTCPANILFTNSGAGGANINYTVTASDNCPGVTLAGVPASGSLFPLGPTTVNATSTDASLNTATCSFLITVQAAIVAIPALSGGALLLLGVGLAGLGIWSLNRARS